MLLCPICSATLRKSWTDHHGNKHTLFHCLATLVVNAKDTYALLTHPQ